MLKLRSDVGGVLSTKAEVFADGSAEFAGRVICGDESNPTGQALKIPYAGTASAEIFNNGSATFKGRVDIEGSYLNVQRATSTQGILQGGYGSNSFRRLQGHHASF